MNRRPQQKAASHQTKTSTNPYKNFHKSIRPNKTFTTFAPVVSTQRGSFHFIFDILINTYTKFTYQNETNSTQNGPHQAPIAHARIAPWGGVILRLGQKR